MDEHWFRLPICATTLDGRCWPLSREGIVVGCAIGGAVRRRPFLYELGRQLALLPHSTFTGQRESDAVEKIEMRILGDDWPAGVC
jgi:hypothetical protein